MWAKKTAGITSVCHHVQLSYSKLLCLARKTYQFPFFFKDSFFKVVLAAAKIYPGISLN
jgi:hypothetical protein